MTSKIVKKRPPRLYVNNDGRRYIKINGKKVFISSKMTNNQLVRVIINNFQKKQKRRKAKKLMKSKINEFGQLEEENKNKTSGEIDGVKASPELAKILFFWNINKKEEEERNKKEKEKQNNQQQPPAIQQQQPPAIQFHQPPAIQFQQPQGIQFQQQQPPIQQNILQNKIRFEDEGEESFLSPRHARKYQNKLFTSANQTENLRKELERVTQNERQIHQKKEAEREDQISKINSERGKERREAFKNYASAENIRRYVQNINNQNKIKTQNAYADDLIDASKSKPGINKGYRLKKIEDLGYGDIFDLGVVNDKDETNRKLEQQIKKGTIYQLPKPLSKEEEESIFGRKKEEDKSNLGETPIKKNLNDIFSTPQTPQKAFNELGKLRKLLVTERTPTDSIREQIFEINEELRRITEELENSSDLDDSYISELRSEKSKFIQELARRGITYKDEEEQQDGEGKTRKGGLYNDEIENIMKRYHKEGFKGVYSSNEISQIPFSHRMSFIINTSPNDKKGKHWQAVYIDARPHGDQSLEFYDSFGDPPSQQFMKDIKELVDKINPDVYLKFKVNKIKDQRANSANCGWHSMRFIIDRINGKAFPDCTGYSDVEKAEKNVEKMKNKFGYI